MPKSTQDCPLKQGSVLAKTAPDGTAGVTFTLKPDGDAAESGGSGAVQFQTLEPGPYDVIATLTDPLVGIYDLVDGTKSGQVVAAQRLDLAFTLKPTVLSVKISGPAALDGATVTATSDKKTANGTTNAQGLVEFGNVPAGTYEVKVTLDANAPAAAKYLTETKSSVIIALGTKIEHPVALAENPPFEVTVLTKAPDKNLGGVKVKIKAGQHAQEATTGSNGVAKFDHAPLADHTIDLDYTVDDAKAYKVPDQAAYTTKTGQTNATTIEVFPTECEVHLALAIKLPDDSDHLLPKDLAVTLRASDDTTIVGKLDEKGVFKDSAGKVPKVKRTLKFSLEFPAAADTWLVFEKAGATATQELIVDADPKFDSKLALKTAAGSRAILWVQADAKLIEIDGVASPADHFTKPNFEFKDKVFIGEATSPVKLTIKPKWQYLRFEYFDRKYGRVDHSDKRISVPPVLLKGSRKTTDGTLQNPAAGGNFMVDAADNDKACHALPWIVTKKVADGTDLAKLDKSMYFQFGETNAWIEATSKTERAIVKLDAAGTDKPKLAPGKDRDKYYDLPKLWTNCFQYTRLPGDDVGKFFDELSETEIEASYDKTKPLRFSLDDIVLTDNGGAQTVQDQGKTGTAKALSKHSRVSIIHLDAADKYSVQIWKPRAKAAYHSDVLFQKEAAAETYRNVLTKYAPNARVVLFCNGPYDIFDKRTEAATYASKHIKGARAGKLADADVTSAERVFGSDTDSFADAYTFSPTGGAGYVHLPRKFHLYYLHYAATDGTTVYGLLLTLYSLRIFGSAHNPGAGTWAGKPLTANLDFVRNYRDAGIKRAMSRWNGKGYFLEQNDDKKEVAIRPYYLFEAKDPEDPDGTFNEYGGAHDCYCGVGDNSVGSSANSSEMYMRKSGADDEGPGWGSTAPGTDPAIADYDGTTAVARCAFAHELGHAAVGLFDDYITSTLSSIGADVPSYEKAQRYPGVPYNHDPVSMMSNNRAVRLRSLWGRTLWVNDEAKTGKTLAKFLDQKVFRAAYAPAGKTKLKYFLPSGKSFYKAAKEGVNAPLGEQGKANLYLYELGEDEFGLWMQNGPYDSMLVIDWKLCATFVDVPVPVAVWAAGSPYTAGNTVKVSAKSYRCEANHTATAGPTGFDTDLTAAKWIEIKPVTWDAGKKKDWIEDVNKRFKKEIEGDDGGRFKLTSSGKYKKVYVRTFPEWCVKATEATANPAGTHFTFVVTGDGTKALNGSAGTLKMGNSADATSMLRYILGRYTTGDPKTTLALADLPKLEEWIKAETGGTDAYAGDAVPLSISKVEPTAGAAEGGDVTITGTNMSDVVSLKFGAIAQATFTKTATTITAKVPANAITAKLELKSNNRTVLSAADFKVLPAITSVEPTTPVAVGGDVTINGTTLTNASAVKFGTVAQPTFTKVSATKLTTTVPATAVTAKVEVTTPDGTATSATDFKVLPPPTVSDFNPKSAKVGDAVTIAGAALDGATSVKIGGVDATVTTNATGQIVATIGAGAASGAVEVTTPGGTVTKDGYTLTT